jgi:hypothetical protein
MPGKKNCGSVGCQWRHMQVREYADIAGENQHSVRIRLGLKARQIHAAVHQRPASKRRAGAHRNNTSHFPCGVLEQAYRELLAEHGCEPDECRVNFISVSEFLRTVRVDWQHGFKSFHGFRTKLGRRARDLYTEIHGGPWRKPKKRTSRLGLRYPRGVLEQAYAQLKAEREARACDTQTH